jgi:hypothetical protein
MENSLNNLWAVRMRTDERCDSMSKIVMRKVWGLGFLTPIQKLIALALADEGVATSNELAVKLRMTPSDVYEILRSIPMTIIFMDGDPANSEYDVKFWLSWENQRIERRKYEKSDR